MKKILLFFCLSLIMVSCEIESSKNGKLDGFWHLTTIDTIATKGHLDVSEKGYFWSVQMHLLQIARQEGGTGLIVFRFENKDNTLRIYDPYANHRENGDPKIIDTSITSLMGINQLDETFKIEKLTSSKMILSSSTLKLYFRRF